MTKYEFEIQSLIKVKMKGNNRHDVRIELINKLYDGEYDAELESQAVISYGKEV